MRNIIFISALCAATAAWAEAPLGCFTRDYSAGHLAKNPSQIVQAMALRIYRDPNYGDIIADMNVEFANQGRVRGTRSANQVMDQLLICWQDGATFGCSVECDGGSFTVTRQSNDSITFQTRGLMVGDVEGCCGAEDIAEAVGRYVKYKLNRADDLACVWN